MEHKSNNLCDAITLYHCSHNSTMADGPIEVPEDATLKGLFFSGSPECQYGDEIYRAYIPGRDCLLHDGVVSELGWADAVKWTKDRDANALTISREQLESACRKAMDDLSIDAYLFNNVWDCAIADARCEPDRPLEDLEGENPGWTLQNVRGLTAQHVGLMGAEMEDDTGISIMLMGDLLLEKVDYDDEHELADEDGYVIVSSRCEQTTEPSPSSVSEPRAVEQLGRPDEQPVRSSRSRL